MKLQGLYIDSFGHFQKHGIELPGASTVVFLGPNEAGKSTLLAFIRGILFGFPVQYSAQHYPALSRGDGGRVVLADQSGLSYTVERRAGPGGGPWVTSPDGPVLDGQSALTRLTGGTSPEAFRNIYAFTLDELQSVAQLNDHDLYSAAQGVTNLSNVQGALSERRRAVFLPGGSNQHVPRAFRQVQAVSQQLQEIQNNARLYGELTARKSQVEQVLEESGSIGEGLRSRRSEIDRLLSGWDEWLELSDSDTRLREMPMFVEFPENPIVRLEGLESQVKQAREDFDETDDEVGRAEAAASAVIPHEDLLYDQDGIEAIRRDRNRFDAAVRDLPERQGELRGMEADFARQLADLGHDWGESELQEFDTSLVVRNQVDTWKESMDEAGGRVRQAEFQLAQERRTLQDHKAALQEARDKLPPQPPTDSTGLSKRQDSLRITRGRLGEYQRHRQTHETLLGQLNALAVAQESPDREPGRISILAIVALAAIGAILVMAGIALGGGALILGIICGLVLVVAAVMLWLTRRPKATAGPSPMAEALRQQAANAESAMETARKSLIDSAAPLGLDGQPDGAALDSAEAGISLAQSALDAWVSASARLEEAARREQLQEQRLESAVKEHEDAREFALQTQEGWRRWLGDRRLNETLTPEAMTSFLARIETARSFRAETHRMRDRVSAIEYDIQEFSELVEPLARRHGLPLDPEDLRRLPVAADELIRRLDEAQVAHGGRKQAGQQAETLRQQLEGRERRLRLAVDELAALLAAGGTDDPEEFRRRSRLSEERQELERRHGELRRNLERLSGPGDRLDSFMNDLADADLDALRGEAAGLDQRQADLESERIALNQELGEIRGELARLSSEEESSGLRVHRNSLLEQLQDHAREWAKLTIAEELLNRTRRKFEQERQPRVIQHAEEFFSNVTGQRYRHLYAPLGEQTITVIDADGSGKRPTQLSRGTREQLYLALRFGLIRGADEHAERLPVVVDEALVNFDPGRAYLAAKAFGYLAETNQVLVFTCHPATAEMFANAAGAVVVDIKE